MKSTHSGKIFLALATIGIIWGTTYLGIRVAVESVPPWFVTGIRQTLAALILLIILGVQKQLRWIGWRMFWRQAIVSTLLLILANGLTTVAEQYITSSLTSLLQSTSPILVFIGSTFLGLENFSLRKVLGLFTGFVGVVLVFWDGFSDLKNPEFRSGILLLFTAITSWAVGTLYTKKNPLPSGNVLLNLLYQFAFAGVVQLVFAFTLTPKYNFNEWTFPSIAAVVYLAVFGSVITFIAWVYALRHVDPTRVSMMSYVNTIIAIVMGWVFLNEPISAKFLLSAALIMSGVFLMNYRKGMFSRRI